MAHRWPLPPYTYISPGSQPGLAHCSGLAAHSGLSPATVLSQMWVLALPAPPVPVGGERPACWSHGARSSLTEACRGLVWQHGQEVGRRPWASPARNAQAQQGSLNLFSFFFLISYKTMCPIQTGQCRPSASHSGPRERLPTPEEPSAPLHRASVRKGVRLQGLCCPCPSCWQRRHTLGPGLLVPAREGGRRGSEGRRRGWVPGWGRPVGRPTVSHRERTMLLSRYRDSNDDYQNEDQDGHTDGDQHFLLWERKESGKHSGAGGGGGGTLRRLTFRAFFWLSRALLTCSCPRST